MEFTMTYFKTSEEIIRQLQNLWNRLDRYDLYGKAVINDAIMVIGSIEDNEDNED